jgi:uncharacterized delta-60 repeat protein
MRPPRALVFFGALLAAGLSASTLSAAGGARDSTFGSSGKVTTDFGGGSYDDAASIVVQRDGKVVVTGSTAGSADASFGVARYAANGALDSTFDHDGKAVTEFAPSSLESAYSSVIQSDGKILAAGAVGIPGAGTASDFALARYTGDGTLDGSFDGDGKVVTNFMSGTDQAFSIALAPDGKVVLAGISRPLGPGPFDMAVARYNADGSLDGSFDGDGKVVTAITPGSDDAAQAVAVQPDGRIVVGGTTRTGGDMRAVLVRYAADGTPDTSFGADGKVVLSSPTFSITAMALQADGKIVSAGLPGFSITRFNQNGSVDTAFDGDGNAAAPFRVGASFAVVIQQDGKIVAAGAGAAGADQTDFAVARFGPAGRLDQGFGSVGMTKTDFGPRDIGYGVAFRAGKIVVAGVTGPAHGNGPNDFAVARYLGGPPPCVVPNVRGKTIARAKIGIRKAGCAVGRVTPAHSKNMKRGHVISQSLRPRTQLANGTRVNLKVSRGRRR